MCRVLTTQVTHCVSVDPSAWLKVAGKRASHTESSAAPCLLVASRDCLQLSVLEQLTTISTSSCFKFCRARTSYGCIVFLKEATMYEYTRKFDVHVLKFSTAVDVKRVPLYMYMYVQTAWSTAVLEQ